MSPADEPTLKPLAAVALKAVSVPTRRRRKMWFPPPATTHGANVRKLAEYDPETRAATYHKGG